MSIYPGEKPYNGIITERQYRQLQLLPELIDVLSTMLADIEYNRAEMPFGFIGNRTVKAATSLIKKYRETNP